MTPLVTGWSRPVATSSLPTRPPQKTSLLHTQRNYLENRTFPDVISFCRRAPGSRPDRCRKTCCEVLVSSDSSNCQQAVSRTVEEINAVSLTGPGRPPW